MHDDRLAESRRDIHGAQRIAHHGAAAGTKFDQPHIFRRAHHLPDRGRPQPDQLAEHLADFRRGGEIAAGAERIARDVIAVNCGCVRQSDMYCATGIGPAAAIKRRISSSRLGTAFISPDARGFLPQRINHKADAREQQRHRQQHAHGKAAEQKAKLRIGLAEQFAEASCNGVAGGEEPDDQPRPLERPSPIAKARTSSRSRPSSAAS